MAKTLTDKQCADIFAEAEQAGIERGNGADVGNYKVIDGAKVYDMPDGLCGFAWVNIKPGNGKFAKWLKQHSLARPDSYYGGVCHWVSRYNQSYERKLAYASAFSEVLNKHGIRAYPGSRLD